ncbi:hypothetical protein [Flavobacterium psychrotrophum]|uniref:hypothetical protein n=1 Tax=Flavobacterium psychrotrophum TaxID=2294119 RepID=UPI000E320BA9|nr:hypothetical protein [Flavobacterium psychrotrophum]
MQTLVERINARKATWERQWKQLSEKQRRKLVLYAFGGYCVLTLIVVIQVIMAFGNAPDALKVDHIENPVRVRQDPKMNSESKTAAQHGK